jgi:MoxR-like ATPase
VTHSEFAKQLLSAIQLQPIAIPQIAIEESRMNNVGVIMNHLVCNRLGSGASAPLKLQYTTYEWNGGIVRIANSRITDHHWSTLSPATLEQMHDRARDNATAYLLTYWDIENKLLHAWALPEDMAYPPLAQLKQGEWKSKAVEISPDDHRIAKSDMSPSFEHFYIKVPLTDGEVTKLVEAVKIDQVAKHLRASTEEDDDSEGEVGEPIAPLYTGSTIAFLIELANHTQDPAWHAANKSRYEKVLRDPTRALVDQIRDRYIEELDREVAGGERPISILKKNDYGKGGYHDHYWFAFYDPKAGSKTRSVQLYYSMLGSEQVLRYGFAMGNYCQPYLERLHAVFMENSSAVAEYFRHAPDGTVVRIRGDENPTDVSPGTFARQLDSPLDHHETIEVATTRIDVIREFPLSSLLDHVDKLVDEIGKFFTWAWPLFNASITGTWVNKGQGPPEGPEGGGELDEDVPDSLEALSDLSSLSIQFLGDLEEALLMKQQVVLVGPPGTSKTFIARQFARYFVRQRPGHQQGAWHTLYMHANWTYEDFFEGIKPVSKNGTLLFESKAGFFLYWVNEGLKGFDSTARHVLVLDEINRCDTAAVLGELLQLLESRGTTIRLLSDRQFQFPRNLFIIGTMNSADRSIGRMDLALRRRFLWLDLYPQPDVLETWLARPGNNPVGFDASALRRCNELLTQQGIPAEQHIGHALFMVSVADSVDDNQTDSPLTEKQLRRIVRFSVLPYIKELLATQYGKSDEDVLNSAEAILLSCLAAAH